MAVPEAAHAVDKWREQTGEAKPSVGIPPHVTLVFPFAPAAEIDETLIAALREIVARVGAFEVEFRETARWPELVYLPPEPAAPFTQLTEALVARFPEYPPYEGTIPLDQIVPHLTVASGDASLFDEVEADVRRHLPITAHVREAVLLEEVEPDWGRWQVRARLPLGD